MDAVKLLVVWMLGSRGTAGCNGVEAYQIGGQRTSCNCQFRPASDVMF